MEYVSTKIGSCKTIGYFRIPLNKQELTIVNLAKHIKLFEN